MNGNDFLNAMTDIDDKYIISAEKNPSKRHGLFIGAMSTVAAAVIAITAVGLNTGFKENHIGVSGVDFNSATNSSFNSCGSNNSVNNVEPPKITSWYYQSLGGMGGPDGSVEPMTDIENPWSAEMNFETLPVYDNFSECSEHNYMTQTLKYVTDTLGYDISEMQIKDNFITDEMERKIREQWERHGVPEEDIQRMICISHIWGRTIIASIENEIDISLNLNSRLDIKMEWCNGKYFSIPNEYKPDSLTITEIDKAGRYMLDTYYKIFGISNPILTVNSSSDNCVEYYEGGTNAESFVNYQLKRVVFKFNTNGDIISIWFRSAGMKKVGDYPIISIDEAKEKLLKNNYLPIISTVEHNFDGTEPIGAVELVYLDSFEFEYVMPFYHFEVGLTAEEVGYGNSGETRYFEYYVPAITDEYLGEWKSLLPEK